MVIALTGKGHNALQLLCQAVNDEYRSDAIDSDGGDDDGDGLGDGENDRSGDASRHVRRYQQTSDAGTRLNRRRSSRQRGKLRLRLRLLICQAAIGSACAACRTMLISPLASSFASDSV